MRPDYDYTLHDDYLELIVSGQYHYDSAIENLASLLDKAHGAGVQRALVDYRELEGIDGGVEKVLYSLKAEETYKSYRKAGGLPLRIAYLARSMDYEPGAEIGRRIPDLEFELFSDRDEAMRWLLFKY